MTAWIFRFRRYLLAVVLVLLAAVGARAQAPEFGYWDRTPLPQQGLATYYNPGVMEEVLNNRIVAQDIDACPECVGTVALLRAGDIGRRVWLQPPGGDPVGPFLVIDCARRQDFQPLLDRNWVVDVSYEVGQYWGMNRPLDGVIVFEDPADTVPGRAVNRIPTPFAVAPADVVISPPTATPAVPALDIPPTAWPTRVPAPVAVLRGRAVAQPAAPEATHIPPTPTAIWPPPLTPIITTPTPAVIATPSGAPGSGSSGVAVPGPTPTDVSLGRPGGELLDAPLSAAIGPEALPPSTVAGTPPQSTLAAPTARPTLARTPRIDRTPILPVIPTATPTATPAPGVLDRILRDLIDLVR